MRLEMSVPDFQGARMENTDLFREADAENSKRIVGGGRDGRARGGVPRRCRGR